MLDADLESTSNYMVDQPNRVVHLSGGTEKRYRAHALPAVVVKNRLPLNLNASSRSLPQFGELTPALADESSSILAAHEALPAQRCFKRGSWLTRLRRKMQFRRAFICRLDAARELPLI